MTNETIGVGESANRGVSQEEEREWRAESWRPSKFQISKTEIGHSRGKGASRSQGYTVGRVWKKAIATRVCDTKGQAEDLGKCQEIWQIKAYYWPPKVWIKMWIEE